MRIILFGVSISFLSYSRKLLHMHFAWCPIIRYIVRDFYQVMAAINYSAEND